jgi:hypothetical protein
MAHSKVLWFFVLIPLNNKDQVQEVFNGIYFDKKYNLLITEAYEDTVFAIRNLKTQAIQFVIEKERPCDASTNDICLDSVSMSNKVLYYRWTTPHKYSDRKSSREKRVRVTI